MARSRTVHHALPLLIPAILNFLYHVIRVRKIGNFPRNILLVNRFTITKRPTLMQIFPFLRTHVRSVF
jgi:hypothetical protein